MNCARYPAHAVVAHLIPHQSAETIYLSLIHMPRITTPLLHLKALQNVPSNTAAPRRRKRKSSHQPPAKGSSKAGRHSAAPAPAEDKVACLLLLASVAQAELGVDAS